MPSRLEILPVLDLPEVGEGADLAALVVRALVAAGDALRPGDVVVVSSKIVSKSLGLVVPDADRDAVVAAQSRRVVAERRTGDRTTRVVESLAGPVMAAAGVDASNTGPGGGLLLLPTDADAQAAGIRAALLRYAALPAGSPLGVVVSDTAGRPWRDGQVDFALGACGLAPLDDLRGRTDADRRALSVTARAVADEVAAAADLVKGKVDAVPVAVLRGIPRAWLAADAAGAGSLVRTGPGDWFALGHVEAVRTSLGVPPGTARAKRLGIPAADPEPLAVRAARVLAVALHGVPDGGIDVEPVRDDAVEVVVVAPDGFTLGRIATRLEVAAHSESLVAELAPPIDGAVRVRLSPA